MGEGARNSTPGAGATLPLRFVQGGLGRWIPWSHPGSHLQPLPSRDAAMLSLRSTNKEGVLAAHDSHHLASDFNLASIVKPGRRFPIECGKLPSRTYLSGACGKAHGRGPPFLLHKNGFSSFPASGRFRVSAFSTAFSNRGLNDLLPLPIIISYRERDDEITNFIKRLYPWACMDGEDRDRSKAEGGEKEN